MGEMVLFNGRLITPTGVVPGGRVRVRDGRIAEVGSGAGPEAGTRVDLVGRYLSPGFIDLHLHGAGPLPYVEPASPGRRHLAAGMTGFLLTTSRGPLDRMVEEIRVEHERLRGTPLGRAVLGVHLEGPFLSPESPGAIPVQRLEPPDAGRMAEAIDAMPWPVRLVTVAPELLGVDPVIEMLVGRGIAVSLGHTHVSYEGARRAAGQGVRATTHTFNAMGAFHHRAPGAIGAALTDDRLNAEVIADGVHVHPAAVGLLARARGIGGIRLGTDATLADRLTIPGYSIDGQVYRDQAGHIAGGLLTLDRAVRNLAHFAAMDVPTAVRAATVNPARLIGLADRKGVLTVGADADLIAFDDDVTVSLVLIGGDVILAV